MFLFEPTPHEDAIAIIRDKTPVRREVFNNLLPELRARAFTVAGIEAFDVLQDIRDKLAELPAGGDWNAIKRELIADLSPYLVQDDDEDARKSATRRAELLLRTHGFQAYQQASYEVMDAQRDVFPYWQYRSMGDHRVRATHAAMDGIVLPANSTYWQGHFPPWEWSCRCQVIPLMEEDVEDMKAAEAHLPMEQRRVLEGAALAEVEQNRRLVRGVNEIYDLRNDRERGNRTGYYWDPADSHLTREQLQGRYTPDVWMEFEAWAMQTNVTSSGNVSVFDWINGDASLAPVDVLPEIQSVETLRDQLNALLMIPDAAERKQQFHDALELPPGERGTLAHTAKTNRGELDKGFAFINRYTRLALTLGDKVKIKRTRSRAAADPKGKYINGKYMDASTVVHELGHILEGRNPDLLKKSLAFRDRRTADETPQWLGPGYNASEVALEDEWVKRGGRMYSGKVYIHRNQHYGSEIISMGVERFMNDPAGFWRDDEDYFTYVLNALRKL